MVALERTGGSWQPGYHVLREAIAVAGANSPAVGQRPGTQTDGSDAAWIAALLAPGLIRPRFVPPPEMRAVRDLPRPRGARGQTRPPAKKRGYKILAAPNIPLARVGSDGFGKRARRLLAALGASARDAAQRSAMALGSWRRKLPLSDAKCFRFLLIAGHGESLRGVRERPCGSPHHLLSGSSVAATSASINPLRRSAIRWASARISS